MRCELDECSSVFIWSEGVIDCLTTNAYTFHKIHAIEKQVIMVARAKHKQVASSTNVLTHNKMCLLSEIHANNSKAKILSHYNILTWVLVFSNASNDF